MFKQLCLSALLISSPVVVQAGPTLVCEYGNTLILTVPRDEYEEEPGSIMKIIVWNGLTYTVDRYNVCQIDGIAIVTYEHVPNFQASSTSVGDHVSVTPYDLFSVEDQERPISEYTREVFYVYEKLIG